MRIHIADAADAVMRLVRITLGGVQDGDAAWVQTYFAPEPGDHLARLADVRAHAPFDGPVSVTWSENGSEDELSSACGDAEALILRRGNVTSRVLGHSPELRLIVQMGEGAGQIDLDAAQRLGIPVRVVPRASLERTAEHVLLFALALDRKLTFADASIRAGLRSPGQVGQPGAESYNWLGLSGVTGLGGRRLGLIGLGAVGRNVVPLARAFGMAVSYSNRGAESRDPEFDSRHGIDLVSIDTLLRSSDFVSVHARLAAGLPPIIGEREFQRMKDGSYFINTSRGRLVDEEALEAALAGGRLAGAALDVHEVEPRSADHPLCKMPNVILTPHVAGGSRLDLLSEIGAVVDSVAAASQESP